MQEIKFRGMRPNSKKWITGGYVQKGIFAYILGNGHFEIECSTEVLPGTVGQYTGLKDSKRTKEYPEGQEIYEGDKIIATFYNEIYPREYIVSWHDNMASFILAMKPNSGYPFDSHGVHSIEVIGNIHDNPELIK